MEPSAPATIERLLVALPLPAFVADAHGAIRHGNPAAERLLGWPVADVAGRPLAQVLQPLPTAIPGEPAPEPSTAIDLLATGETEISVRRRDGRRISVRFCVSPLPAEGESGPRCLCLLLAGRQRLDVEAAASRDDLAAILDGVQDGVIVQAANGVIVQANTRAARLLGAPSPDALAGRPLNEVIDQFHLFDETGQPVDQARAGRLLGALGDAQLLMRHRAPRGDDERWLTLRTTPARDERGRITLAVTTLRDVTDVRRAELRLREAEARYRTLVEQIPAVTYSVALEPSNHLLYVSPQMRTLTGFSPEELIADHSLWRSRIHPDDLERFLAEDARARQARDLFRVEYRFIARDGRVVWLRDEAVTVAGAAGQPLYWHGVVTDLTERKQREEAQRFLTEAGTLLSQTLDYQTTLDRVAELAVPYLADYCFVYLLDGETARRVAMAHVDPDKVSILKEIAGRFPDYPDRLSGPAAVTRTGRPALLPDVTDAMLASYARDREYLELLRRLAPRSYLCVPLRARDQILGAIAFVTAESGRRLDGEELALAEGLARLAGLAVANARLHQESREHATRVQLLAEASRAFGEARLDLTAVLHTVVETVARIFGDAVAIQLLSADRATLEPVASYDPDPEGYAFMQADVSPARHQISEGLQGQVVRTGEPLLIPRVDSEQLRILTKPEYVAYLERFPVASLLFVPLRVRGRVIGTLALWRARSGDPYTEDDQSLLQDLADRAALAVENARLYREAQAAIKLREEFLSIAAHEFRTPLTTLKGYFQLLERQLQRPAMEPARVEQALAKLSPHMRRFELLVNDLLDVSRLQHGGLALRPEPCDLARLAGDVVERFRLAGDGSADRLVLDAPGPVEGVWDPARIDQVLSNLISNALKYSPAGDVRVIVRRPDDQELGAEVSVSDLGPGIPEEDQRRLFEPFFRGGAAPTTVDGAGLGLYISAQIVRQHGGSIAVRSQPGQGSVFSVRLPARTGAPPEPPG